MSARRATVKPTTGAPISAMRYAHLVVEAGSLLAAMRDLGASFEDIERANRLLSDSTPQTIGAIIQDIQSQVLDLQRDYEADGINASWFDSCED